MKTFWPAVLFLAAVTLTLCACGGTPDYGQLPLQNSQSSDTLTLNMSRDKVDALLGTDGDWDETTKSSGLYLVDVDYHNQTLGPVTAWFQNDEAVYFSVGVSDFPQSIPAVDSPWSLSGITLGSSRADIEAALGIPTQEYADGWEDIPRPRFQVLKYNYLSDGTLLVTDTGDESFSAAFLLLEDQVVLFGIYSAGYDLDISDNAVLHEVSDSPTPIYSPLGYSLTIPAGCTYEPTREELHGLHILRDEEEIGGLFCLSFPDPQRFSTTGFTHEDFVQLLQPLLGSDTDVSEFAVSSSSYGSFVLKLDNTNHYFFPSNDCFYDLWVRDNVLSPAEEHDFLDSFHVDM